MKSWIYFFSTMIFVGCGQRQELTVISLNNAGVTFLKADSVSMAQKNFMEALALKPFDPILHNNLGVSLDAAKEFEKAIQSYTFAEGKADQESIKFSTRFNLAQGLAKQAKIDAALGWYQQALEIDPTSNETKTNIELLTKQKKSDGGGGGDSKDKGKDKENQDKDKKDDKDDKKDDKEKPREYQGNEKYKPRPFKGELGESEVKKILGELKQQEQKNTCGLQSQRCEGAAS